MDKADYLIESEKRGDVNEVDSDSNKKAGIEDDELCEILGNDNFSILGSKADYSALLPKMNDSFSILGSKADYSALLPKKMDDSFSILGSKVDYSALLPKKMDDSFSILGSKADYSALLRKMNDSFSILGSKADYSVLLPKMNDSFSILGSKVDYSALLPKMNDSFSILGSKVDYSALLPKMNDSFSILGSKADYSALLLAMDSLGSTLKKLPISFVIEKVKPNSKDDKTNNAFVRNTLNNDIVPLDSLASTMASMDIVNDLTAKEVFSLYSFLIKFPLLGLSHEVGKKIFREISKQSLIEVSNLKLYRGRERDTETKVSPFSEIEMFEAPYGIAGHGRFNVNGQGELYTCGNKEVALKEINAVKDSHKKYEIIEWRLNKKVKMLDLTNNDSELVKYCLFKRESNNAQEYLLPNFIAQCAKYNGISGIKIKSTIDISITNYIFFDFEKKWFDFIDLAHDVTLSFK